jgi:ribonucleoside-diphosphate reductase alpha chain
MAGNQGMQLNTPNQEQNTSTQPQNSDTTDVSSIAATAPGQFRVIRRNGKVTSYDLEKIAVAVTKAFLAVEGGNAAASSRIHEIVGQLAKQVEYALTRRIPDGGTFHIEDIQDQVELALMRSGHQKVARSYVIYRDEHARARAEELAEAPAVIDGPIVDINVAMADGSFQPLDNKRLNAIVAEACSNLNDVDATIILEDTHRNLFADEGDA